MILNVFVSSVLCLHVLLLRLLEIIGLIGNGTVKYYLCICVYKNDLCCACRGH